MKAKTRRTLRLVCPDCSITAEHGVSDVSGLMGEENGLVSFTCPTEQKSVDNAYSKEMMALCMAAGVVIDGDIRDLIAFNNANRRYTTAAEPLDIDAYRAFQDVHP